MPQYFGNDDDSGGLAAALNFSGTRESADDGIRSAAFAFSASYEGGSEDSLASALREHAPAKLEETKAELDAIREPTRVAVDENEPQEDVATLFTVTNPAMTVSVSALMDGRTQRVRLLPHVTSMTESELAAEIVVLADLARVKGLAGQRSCLESTDVPEEMRELGLTDGGALRDFVTNFITLPTPEKAAATQAEVFAARYPNNHD